MVQHADKGSDLFEIARWCNLKDWIDLLLLQFDTFSGKYEI
jgi:hypothetical protein